MTRALATAALLGVGWLIAALAFIAGIVWALYEIACKETA
jgi:uncharacterized membrane protein YqaE (UPF0057 family)